MNQERQEELLEKIHGLKSQVVRQEHTLEATKKYINFCKKKESEARLEYLNLMLTNSQTPPSSFWKYFEVSPPYPTVSVVPGSDLMPVVEEAIWIAKCNDQRFDFNFCGTPVSVYPDSNISEVMYKWERQNLKNNGGF
jgi:hypothetical protein